MCDKVCECVTRRVCVTRHVSVCDNVYDCVTRRVSV